MITHQQYSVRQSVMITQRPALYELDTTWLMNNTQPHLTVDSLRPGVSTFAVFAPSSTQTILFILVGAYWPAAPEPAVCFSFISAPLAFFLRLRSSFLDDIGGARYS